MRAICQTEMHPIQVLGVDLWYDVGCQIVEDPGSLDLSEIEDAKASTQIARQFIISQLLDRTAFVLAEDREPYVVA
jgi:hypothetical protein